MKRYYELVLSGPQLALILSVLAAMLLLAFGLGVAVGLGQPEKEKTPALKARELVEVVAASDQSGSEMRQVQEQPTAMSRVSGTALEPTPTPSPSLLAEKAPLAQLSPTPELALPVATLSPSPPPRKPAQEEIWVQVAAVREKRHADGIRQRVIAQGFRPNQVKIVQGSEGKYRVKVGPFPDRESGGRVAQRLGASGFPNAFMVTP
ncbi:MAG: SPOR domain-containing protein [Thermoanaerobaculaceae bacterium]